MIGKKGEEGIIEYHNTKHSKRSLKGRLNILSLIVGLLNASKYLRVNSSVKKHLLGKNYLIEYPTLGNTET